MDKIKRQNVESQSVMESRGNIVEDWFTCIHERKTYVFAKSQEAAYGSNTFMIYTGAPQNTRRKN
ncbi:hypothetical protein ACEQPO_19310 [Bacillus sp. SL00103]